MSEYIAPSIQELDAESWECLASAVSELEQAWVTTACPDLATLMPDTDGPIRARVLIELIKADQELRWESGNAKYLEAYLDEWADLADHPPSVKELLESECLTRAVLDALPTEAELHDRFPDIYARIDLKAIEASAKSERASLRDSIAKSRDSTQDSRQDPHATGPAIVRGTTFGRYQLREILGRGAMGQVYRAYDPKLDRDVALKISHFTDAHVLQRFAREARAAAKIRHPNICPVYDVGEIDGTHYITMALIEGQSLAERINERTVDVPEAAELVKKLALAVEEVHVNGAIHRDIKPANVMIDRSGEPLLMDFGLARPGAGEQIPSTASSQTLAFDSNAAISQSGALVGTPCYMSPEQAAGQPADACGDVYSLGVLLYELLAGTVPFTGSLHQVLLDIQHSAPRSPHEIRPGVPDALESICLRAMAKNPSERYSTACDFARALAEFVETSPTKYPPFYRRLAKVLGGMSAVALLLVAGVLIYIKTGDGTLVLDLPPDAVVKIDGRDRDASQPINLTVGEHELEIRLNDTAATTSVVIRWRGTEVNGSDLELLAYESDFSSDPHWVTNNAARFRWDSLNSAYVLTQTNINDGGEYAYHDVGFAFHSFRLEYDIKVDSLLPYAAAVNFGLYDHDLSTENGSYVHVAITKGDEGTVFYLDSRDAEDVGHDDTATLPNSSVNEWFHVVMKHDSERRLITAELSERASGKQIARVSVSDIGKLALDMTRVGSSNIRTGSFQSPSTQTIVLIDNLKLFVSGPLRHSDYAWKRFVDHRYAVTHEHGAWKECEAEAVAAGGHPVTINDADENIWLANNFGGNFARAERGTPMQALVWVGLARVQGEWIWTSGERVEHEFPWWRGLLQTTPNTDHAYLHVAPHPQAGTWGNFDHAGHGKNPRGIIEVAE